MDTDTIKTVLDAILDDEAILDSIPIELVGDVHQLLSFYLLDRDLEIDELDFS